MRVLLVVNTLPPVDVSGVGEQVLQLAEGLRSLGHRVEILGRGKKGARGPKVMFPIMVVGPCLRACRRFRPDVVQVHESDGALAALALKTISAGLYPHPRLIALLQVSYLEEIRAVRAIRSKGRKLGSPSMEEWIFRWLKAPFQVALGCLSGWLADLVLAPSRRTADELEHDYRLEVVRVLPNATSSLEESTAASFENIPGPGPFLFVGRLRIRKGVEVLLHAISQLVSKGREANLIVVGEGEHAGRLMASALDLGLEGRVSFAGRRDKTEIGALMSKAAALVVPSIYEGMPLVVLEAMSRSLPIVASRVSGIPEVLEESGAGWLVRPEDVDDLAAALESVMGSPTEARRRGQMGRDWVAQEANPVLAARRWTDLLAEIWPNLRKQDSDREEGGGR